jgi:hypothetical protein
MSQAPFQARFAITSSITISPTEWEVLGEVYDYSYSGFGPSDASVGNLIFDESSYDGTVNRWKIITIVSRGTPTVRSLTVRVIYDEPGVPAGTYGADGPTPCDGMICDQTALKQFAMQPASGWTGVGESLKNFARNVDFIRADDTTGVQSYYAEKDTGGNQGPLYVTASATGITYTAPTGGNGLYIVNVPTGVVVYSAFINAADTDCKTGNILEVEFTYAGAERNNSNADATYANVQLLEKDIIADGPPSESTPLNYKVWLNGFYAQVIDIGSGSITYKMGQIQYRRFTLAFNF